MLSTTSVHSARSGSAFLAADGHVVHHVGPLRALGVGLVVRDKERPAGLELAQNLNEGAVEVRPEIKRLEGRRYVEISRQVGNRLGASRAHLAAARGYRLRVAPRAALEAALRHVDAADHALAAAPQQQRHRGAAAAAYVERLRARRDFNERERPLVQLPVASVHHRENQLAHLAARAVLRAGAGLAGALVPYGNGLAVRNGLAEIMVREMPGTSPGLWPSLPSGNLRLLLEASVDRAQALVIGPGMGRSEAAQALLRALLSCAERPCAVLDADALVLLAREPELLRGLREQDVLTPHPGEAAALLGTTSAQIQADRLQALRTLCSLTPACVVLKGAGTLIGQQRAQRLRPVCVSPWDVPSLAVGGSGDVLAGCMGALLARRAAHPAGTLEGDCPVDALTLAAVGVSWHALAGRAVAEKYPTRGNLAHELADVLPSVHAAHCGQRARTGEDGKC